MRGTNSTSGSNPKDEADAYATANLEFSVREQATAGIFVALL
jgi:hypothetical protein